MPDPEPTELEMAQQRAMDAMNAAKTASDNAAMAAKEAMDAGMNLATQQTGAMSGMLAYEADKYAKMAMAEYMNASDANEDAMAAMTITAAVGAAGMAESAQAMAEGHETMAVTKGDAAEQAAMMELMIVEKTKTVGDTSIEINGMSHSQTIDDKTVVTGLMEDMNPMHTTAMVTGVPAADGPPVVAHVQATAERMTEIGYVYDSSDDMARLMLITSYAGTKMAKVYAAASGADVTSTTAGMIQIDGQNTADDDTDDVFSDLKPEGMYYLAGEDDANDGLSEADVVADDAKAKRVYSYRSDDGSDGDLDTDDDVIVYVVHKSTLVEGETTTNTYQVVDIKLGTDQQLAGDVGEQDEATARLAEKTDYEHIHFGVWAGLGDAEDDGMQELADLGIGFVQNYSGMGMTEVMPNFGSASYEGDWAATEQAADPDGNGDIMLRSGAASMMANFGMGKVTATLMGLAVLEGDIDGSMFMGDEASVHDMDADTDGVQNTQTSLALDGKFTGSFSGAFYGDQAAEAGGVFDFMSDDMEDGAFRGAFGGKQE